MKDSILERIAENSPFGLDEVSRCYEAFKSYDLLIAACLFAQTTGIGLLEIACLRVKSQGLIEDYYKQYAKGVRWTRAEPTIGGWYWCMNGEEVTAPNVEIVWVYLHDGTLCVGVDNTDCDPVGEYAEWWFGPMYSPPLEQNSDL